MTAKHASTELLERARGGDREAFDALTAPVRERLVAFARSRIGPALRGKLDAEDVAQDATLKAFESIRAFRGEHPDSLWSWLTSISERLIWNASRKRSVKEATLSLEQPGEEVSPSRGLRRKERLARLRESLSNLKRDQQEVLVLAKIEGLKAKEIAQRLGRSEEAVRQMISRALKALRDGFGETESLHLPDHAEEKGADDVLE